MAKSDATRPDGNGISLVAGEVSGDMLAAAVLSQLKVQSPNLKTFGIGGPKMAATGFDAWWPSETLSVRGYVEVISVYAKLASIRKNLGNRLIADPPKLFMGVDAPDFNLDLAKRLKEKKIRTAHFISPSIWAWRGGRIDKIRESVDHMLVVFPFEEQIYRKAKIPATFVGHPLADQIPIVISRENARAKLDMPNGQTIIAILPGSRMSEIAHNTPRFIKTMQVIAQMRKDWHFVWPAATPAIKEKLTALMAAAQLGKQFPVTILDGQSHDAMAASNGVLVASGTATLEAALFKRPMIISYHMNPISYRIMKPMAYLPFIGLPNILSGEFTVPEFVQDAAKPEAMANALVRQVDNPDEVERLTKKFTDIHHQLRQGCAQRAANLMLDLAQ
jgi:lipid-A-disaccharide synthase